MMTQQDPLERYKVIDELGSGAVGKVYAARDQSTGAAVALKILDPALLGESSANLAALFLKNARSAARLRHRNIVKILDAGEAGGTAYIAMELLEGESLRNMLENGPLPAARAIQIFDDIASALAYAHEEGVIHRGVKPSNIIVLRSGVAKLCDFGIGQIGESARRYMSPEQVRGDPVDHRSDLFSLGAVFYEMLTRVAPFQGNSPKEIGESILRAEPPPPSKVNPHIPGALDGLVLKMLARDPDQRFADARILLRDLQRAEEGLGLGSGASASIEESKREPTLQTPVEFRPDPSEIEEFQRRNRIPADDPFYADAARFRMDRLPEERPSGSRATSLAALALLLALISVGVALFWNYSPSPREPVAVASRAQEAPAPAPVAAPPRPTPPPPVAEAPAPAKEPAGQASSGMPFPPNAEPPKPLAAQPAPPVQAPSPPVQEPSPAVQAEKSPAREPEPPAIAEAAPAPKALPAPRPTAKMSEPQPQPGGTATLIIAVSPQGEVYVDGKHYGTTPPITTLDLEPGMRRIEIRSGSRKPYLTYMTVEAGDERRIRHDFAAKPIRPPR